MLLASKDFGSAILLAGAITYAWLVGLTYSRPRAAWLGLATGFSLGTLYVAVVLSVKTALPLPRILGIAIGNGLTLWGVLGLAGGLVLHRVGSVCPSLAVTAAMVTVVLVGDWVWAPPGKGLIASWPSDLAMRHACRMGLGLGLWPAFDQLVRARRQSHGAPFRANTASDGSHGG